MESMGIKKKTAQEVGRENWWKEQESNVGWIWSTYVMCMCVYYRQNIFIAGKPEMLKPSIMQTHLKKNNANPTNYLKFSHNKNFEH